MKRRGFLRWGCAHCALLHAWAAQAQVSPDAGGGQPAQPTIDETWRMPGRFTRPDPGTDEGGLWAIMDREEQRLRRSPFILRDEALRDYLQQLACRLGGAHCPDMRVYPVRNAVFNASMAPNGMMQVWSGLLLRVDNEAQLAAILGHEIGHFLQRHSLERLRSARGASAAALLMAPFGVVGAAGQLGLIAGQYAYSRDHERDADTIGVLLMREAGYETAQAAVVWSNLLAELAARPDGLKSSLLFATHPPSDERRDVLARMGKPGGETGERPFAERTARWQFDFLDDELKRGQYAETLALLDRKIAREEQRADLRYFRGEARRLRAQDDDLERALTDLNTAARMTGAPAQTHRAIGLLLRARNDRDGAAASFNQYLQVAPDAPDAGMIKSYLSELKS